MTRGLAYVLGKASKEVNNKDSVFSQPSNYGCLENSSTGGLTVDYYCDVDADVKIVKPIQISCRVQVPWYQYLVV